MGLDRPGAAPSWRRGSAHTPPQTIPRDARRGGSMVPGPMPKTTPLSLVSQLPNATLTPCSSSLRAPLFRWRYRSASSHRRRRPPPPQRATYATLHTARWRRRLREGLTASAASKASRHLRDLLGTSAIATRDSSGVLAWDGVGEHHGDAVATHVTNTLASGRTQVLGPETVECHRYPTARSATRSSRRSPATTSWSARSRRTAATPQPGWCGPRTRWRAGSRPRWNWRSSIVSARGRWRQRSARCGRRSARTSSTTR